MRTEVPIVPTRRIRHLRLTSIIPSYHTITPSTFNARVGCSYRESSRKYLCSVALMSSLVAERLLRVSVRGSVCTLVYLVGPTRESEWIAVVCVHVCPLVCSLAVLYNITPIRARHHSGGLLWRTSSFEHPLSAVPCDPAPVCPLSCTASFLHLARPSH